MGKRLGPRQLWAEGTMLGIPRCWSTKYLAGWLLPGCQSFIRDINPALVGHPADGTNLT